MKKQKTSSSQPLSDGAKLFLELEETKKEIATFQADLTNSFLREGEKNTEMNKFIAIEREIRSNITYRLSTLKLEEVHQRRLLEPLVRSSFQDLACDEATNQATPHL